MTATERILDLTARGEYGLREAILFIQEHPMRAATLTEWLKEGRTLYRPGTVVTITAQHRDSLGREIYFVTTPDGQEHVCFTHELKEN